MIKDKLIALLESLVDKTDTDLVEVFYVNNSLFGDFTTNLAMKLAAKISKSPIEIAKNLEKEFPKTNFVERVEVVKPGYLNFFVKEQILLKNLDKIVKDKKKFGQGSLYKGKKIMVEFAHPNPFKIMHIGHLRNIILGESLVRLLENQGARVIRTNYQGDVGMHVAKCVWAMTKVPIGSYPKGIDERVAYLGQCYSEGAMVFEKDERAKSEIVDINQKIYEKKDKYIMELCQLGVSWSLVKFREIYKRLDTYFDKEYFESEVLDLGMKFVKQALDKGILVKSKGAVVFKGQEYGLDTRVFLNKQGFLTYEGKELGLAWREFTDFGKLDLCIHNVAVEQLSFFKVTFKVQSLLNPKLYKDKQYHNAYEFVGLKSGKMSSRKGDVVSSEEILNEANKKIKAIVIKNKSDLSPLEIDLIAVGAVKYAYLKMSPFKYLAFDLDSSVSFSGDSGPYLQYTYARGLSILSKNDNSKKLKPTAINNEELIILKKLIQFELIVRDAIVNYSPNYIATYLNDLAKLFNNYYSKHQILGNEFRLKLTTGVCQVIENGLYLLGIKTIEKM